MKTVYEGEHTNDLAVQDDPEHDWYGWLFYRHPDGQWVSLCDLKKTLPLVTTGQPDPVEQGEQG